MLRVGALLLGLLAPAPHARANDILDALRADRWTEAEALAALHPDPVARKIVLHARLLTPGAAGIVEVGLTATLLAFPGSALGVTSGVLLYRLITFGLEIPVGGLTLAGWWWSRRARGRAAEAAEAEVC